MTAKRLAALVLVVIALAWWFAGSGTSGSHEDAHDKTAAPTRSVDTSGLSRQLQRTGRTGSVEWRSAPGADGVTISGEVIDVIAGKGVAGIEVVFRTPDGGEASTTTTANGSYRIQVAS